MATNDGKKDYRNTSKCPNLVDVVEKKNTLEQRMRSEHKNTKIMYNLVKEKHGDYFRVFANIYNNKCAYCGALLGFTDIRLFEIDHYICESAFADDTNGRAEAGKLKNLAFSCYSCNRGKSSIIIESDYQLSLNPDDNSISNIFFRDDDYYIKIEDSYTNDEFVSLFYGCLLLGSEVRRLDYLIIEMNNLIIQLKNNAMIAGKLEECLRRLLQKKNCSLA